MKKLFYLMSATILSLGCFGCLQVPSKAATRAPYQVEPSKGGKLIYVSPDGNDKGLGSENEPLATITEALKQAVPGSVIRLLPGVWHTAVKIHTAGTPLTIEGARDVDGNWLSEINASIPVDPSQWQARPDIGPNVYSLAVGKVGSILVDGKSVVSLYKEAGDPVNKTYTKTDSTGKRIRPFTADEVMQWPDDKTIVPRFREDTQIPFWKTLGGVYSEWVIPNEIVLRLADGSNPAQHEVGLCPVGAAVGIDDSSHVTLKNIAIQGGGYGIEISGKGAINNTVEDCFIRNGRRRIVVGDGAYKTRVVSNRIEMGFIGHPTGSRALKLDHLTAEESMDLAQKSFIYTFFKKWASERSQSDDVSIWVGRGSRDTLVEGNILRNGLVGIRVSNDSSDVKVISNDVRHFSSVGTIARGGVNEVVYDRNYFSDCHLSFRFQEMNWKEPARKIWILRNVSVQPEGEGKHVFIFFDNTKPNPDYPEHQVLFAHNTFIGGASGVRVPAEAKEGKGLPEFSFVDNRFIGCDSIFGSSQAFLKDPKKIGAFDYNQIAGGLVSKDGTPVWQGKHCIVSKKMDNWKWDGHFHIEPPAAVNDPGHHAGIDISQPYTLDKQGPVQFSAAPFFKPGYFEGNKPDLGSPLLQH